MELKSAVVGLAALGGVMLAAGSASAAMPNGLPHADQVSSQATDVEQVRWICGPWGRCVWRPGRYWDGWLLPSASLGLGRRLGLAPSSPLVVTA